MREIVHGECMLGGRFGRFRAVARLLHNSGHSESKIQTAFGNTKHHIRQTREIN